MEEADTFSIVTSKSVDRLIGDTIWVLTGEGEPRNYYLCSCFVVSQTGREEGYEFENCASGTKGVIFQPRLRLNALTWFPEFRTSQANFSLGLQPIKDKYVPLLKNLAQTAGYTIPE